MIKHYIIMSSSYSDGTRIALDIAEEKLLNQQTIKKIIEDIKSHCDEDVPLSTHFIETQSLDWESVKEYDPFFEDVECIKSASEFANKIKKDRTISGLDVANYILSKIKCTHLSLEKLVYFAYAEYLCDYSEKLFEDKIYAFSHGPVIDSVYNIYKKSGYDYLKPKDENISAIVKEMPIKSRILFAKDGIKKIQSIDKTIEKYGKYSASTLVGITHRQDSPWSKTDSKKAYQIISDDLIRDFHCVEYV